MKTKQCLLQFIYSEYDYYCTYVKYLQNRISGLDILDIKYNIKVKNFETLDFEKID